jgi:hypothetical protein
MASKSENWKQRAERYRNRAEEMRIFGETMESKKTQEAFESVAAEYEELAETAERSAAIEQAIKRAH